MLTYSQAIVEIMVDGNLYIIEQHLLKSGIEGNFLQNFHLQINKNLTTVIIIKIGG